MITVTRKDPGPFADHHVRLLQTFADQAVIAIQNVHLFDQLQHRTDDLAESLQQQTATSEVLQIISSSPSDLAPIFDKMLENATRVCGGEFGSMILVEADMLRQAALYNAPPALANARANKVLPLHPQSSMTTAIRSRQVVHIEDVRNSRGYLERAQTSVELVELGGARTIVVVPMLREDEVIGMITVYRQEVRPFSDKQIDLLTNFARQAVIAIENARLLRELRQRTDDLSEALVYQTGSSNILKVIASSPTDVGPVLKAIVESACELCDAVDAIVLLKDGDSQRMSAHHGPIPIDYERWPLSRKWVAGRAFLDRKPVHVHDLLSVEGDEFPDTRQRTARTGTRSILSVPLLREGKSIGTIVLRRTEVHPFSDKQIALLQTFADQAVIALGNVQLFEEVQAKTHELTESLQQQTATSEVLQIISSSPGDLEPVFNAMLENATSICEAKFGHMFLLDGDDFRTAALRSQDSTYPEWLKVGARLVLLDNPHGPLAQIVLTRRIVHIIDLSTERAYIERNARMVALVESSGARTFLGVPMFKDDELVGVIAIYRQEVRPFTEKQITLVSNFASQAVIAIENTRLLNELRRRTDELSNSLNDLRAAQDRLIQTEKLASLGQLTAGIAHEIKNPLNFVNNFSALSVELVEELNDLLKPATLDNKTRVESDELTHMLKSNLEKVVQHGKRADSIVKNMLLHSREGSGERRLVNLNGLVEECLNLAYHGARAENQEFKINLERSFDPTIGRVDLFPQEMTRVLLNLISNGVYAATKRKAETKLNGYEPTLAAATKNLGDSVEIRIRDNGGGIPAEVMDKIFNPFFTTKPPGEGTGLGLSLSHDIVVKQHGGSIEVDTRPGEFTEFKVILPRTAGTSKAGADK